MKNLAFLLIFIQFIACTTPKQNELNTLQGEAIGTTYTIKYLATGTTTFEPAIDSIIKAINKSTSTYIATSDISKINDGDTTVVVDAYFEEVFTKSAKIYSETQGDFDPTVGILVNAWGFGPENELAQLDSLKVDSLLNYVGFDKIKLENHKIIKQHPSIYLDFNAIGKGYLVDLVGRLFEKTTFKTI